MAGKEEAVTEQKRVVLDANILLRAVFGVRVRHLLETYEDSVIFYAPDVCLDDARKYIPSFAATRQFDPGSAIDILDRMAALIETVDRSMYEQYESSAKQMIWRDVDDWPVIATAILLSCPVWTEDQDFFGSGVATWTTKTIELFLANK